MLRVALFSRDEEHASLVQFAEEVEAVVSAVPDRHVPGSEVRAYRRGLRDLMPVRGVDDDEVWQHVRDVRAHVQLRRGLAVDVLRPVYAVERKRYDGCVDRVDAPGPEPGERPPVAQAPESRGAAAEMVAQRPVEALGDLRVARAVRVRERVPLRRGDATALVVCFIAPCIIARETPPRQHCS